MNLTLLIVFGVILVPLIIILWAFAIFIVVDIWRFFFNE